LDGAYFSLLPVVALVVFASWLLSVVTKNYSWVDRLWSILPPVYVGWVAASAGFADLRLDLMAGLTTLWGVRLTYNFARKGGYRLSEEDYRWAVLRARMSPARFQLFNATFVAPYQNVLLFLMAAPAHAAWQHRTPLGALDVALAAVFLLLFVGETVADQQQWRFHQAKAAAKALGETLEPPFCTTGLFRFSRHPNFFCEICMWWVIYGFALAASGEWVHPTGIGALLLTLLFLGSTSFTERITAGKYPSYARYQATTSRLIPWFPARSSERRAR
jgi:steroid 5-alpha reductase family enzyme